MLTGSMLTDMEYTKLALRIIKNLQARAGRSESFVSKETLVENAQAADYPQSAIYEAFDQLDLICPENVNIAKVYTNRTYYRWVTMDPGLEADLRGNLAWFDLLEDKRPTHELA